MDVGCGFGGTSSHVLEAGGKAVGIDLSYGAARCAHKIGVTSVQANSECLPFRNGSFDKALFMGTLEHFPNPKAALQEAGRTLKTGAKVCLVVPNSRFPLFRYLNGTGQIHETPRSFNEWKKLFAENGFHPESCYSDVGPGWLDRGILGIPKRLALAIVNLLPIEFTYQFVIICRYRQ